MTYFVFIHDPGLQFFVPAIVAILLFGDLVDGEVLQPSVLRQNFSMASLADARRACDYDIGVRPHFRSCEECKMLFATHSKNIPCGEKFDFGWVVFSGEAGLFLETCS
jgi:hypothetical protein